MFSLDIFFKLHGFESHAQLQTEDVEPARVEKLYKWLEGTGAVPRYDSPTTENAESPQREQCPIHHKSKAGVGEHLYCPTKLDDGSWCQWNATSKPNPVPPVATAPLCPTHHKSKEGKHGLYCPTRLEDGTYCKWTG